MDETPACFWDMIGRLARKAQPSHVLSTRILPYLKSPAWLAWLSGNCVKDAWAGPQLLLPPTLSPATLGRPQGPAGMAHIGKYR